MMSHYGFIIITTKSKMMILKIKKQKMSFRLLKILLIK